jgi:hypothetical protein
MHTSEKIAHYFDAQAWSHILRQISDVGPAKTMASVATTRLYLTGTVRLTCDTCLSSPNWDNVISSLATSTEVRGKGNRDSVITHFSKLTTHLSTLTLRWMNKTSMSEFSSLKSTLFALSLPSVQTAPYRMVFQDSRCC